MNKILLTLLMGLSIVMVGCGERKVYIDNNGDRISALEARVELNEAQDTLQDQLIASNTARIEALEALAAQQQTLNAEQQALNEAQAALDAAQQAQIDALASGTAEQVAALQAQIDALSDTISSLSSTVASQGDQISILNNSVTEINNSINDINDALDALEDAVAALESNSEDSESSVSLSNMANASCTKVTGTDFWFKVSSSKPTVYDASGCSNSDKVHEFSDAKPVFFLSDTKLGLFDGTSESMKIVSFQ